MEVVVDSLLARFTNAFPLWLVVCSGWALWEPVYFTWFSGPWITYGLGVIMLGMGLTLTADDFLRVLRLPRWVMLGVALQYTVMPLAGWGLAHLFRLPPAYAVGLVLVACCPGGTASNVICYLARANVALSVTLTACSTVLAAAATPTLTAWLAGSYLPVDAWGLFLSTLQVVLVPVAIGVALNHLLPNLTQQVSSISPAVAVVVIIMIVASVLGAGREQALASGGSLIAAVLALHGCGFGLGYGLALLLSRQEQLARTIGIEVGMQNSGLGAHLARQHFPAGSGVDIPSALSALTHCLYGSALASWWRRHPSPLSLETSGD